MEKGFAQDRKEVKEILNGKTEDLLKWKASFESLKTMDDPTTIALKNIGMRLAEELYQVWRILEWAVLNSYGLKDRIESISNSISKSQDENLKQEIESIKKEWRDIEPIVKLLKEVEKKADEVKKREESMKDKGVPYG